MGDQVYELVISVDLSCCRCRKAIQDYLCQMQRKQCMRIVAIVYDEKNNSVLVSGPFDPEQLKRKLLCKLSKIIICIEIREPKVKPKSPENKCIDKCKKECKEKPKKECEEKPKKECENKCKCKKECKEKPKKECEEKPKRECENKCKCKCKRKCKCDCEGDLQGRPPQVTIVCCARPCPCWIAWSNNYRCCSCGVESWPGMCGPGWGSGSSHGGHPQWSNCVSSQQSSIIVASAESSCSIM